MKIFLTTLFSFYLVIEFGNACIAWTRSKSKKESIWRFVDVLISEGMIFAFIKLTQLLSEVG